VKTSRGTVEAERLVVAPGSWAPRLLADLCVPMRVTRQVVYWFRPSGPASYEVGDHPIFIWERPGVHPYGFPVLDGPDAGAKVGLHHHGDEVDPDHLDRVVAQREVDHISEVIRGLVPTMTGTFLRAVVCLYTTTPDQHFVVGTHPGHPNVVVACGFSGHGFKFVPLVGEILADLALEGTTAHPVGLFDPARFR